MIFALLFAFAALDRPATMGFERVMRDYFDARTSLIYTVKPENVSPASFFTDGFRIWEKEGDYGQGLEDCAILNGIALSSLCDRYQVTGDEMLAEPARRLAQGLINLGTVHGVKGFIARGICVEDGKSVCALSSIDQYTHAIHGLWRYWNSPLCDKELRPAIRTLLKDVADFMTREVVEANDWSFPQAVGTGTTRGITKMRFNRPHEGLRLSMVYAAAWCVTGKRTYLNLYRKYLDEGIVKSNELGTMRADELAEIEPTMPDYSLLQMQTSIELLLGVETDAVIRRRLRDAMDAPARIAAARAIRLGSRDTQWLCGAAELSLAQTMVPDREYPEAQRQLLEEAIGAQTLETTASVARTIELAAAWWRMRLKPPFRGIVTCVFDWQTNSCLMVEARNPDGPAMYVGGMMGGHPLARLVGAESLRPGDEIEVDGFMEKMLLDPGIVAREIRVTGHRTFGPPRLVSAREILEHKLNNCRVAVEGDLENFYDVETYVGRLTVIQLLTKDGPLTLNLKGIHPDIASLEGRCVRAEGVVLPVPNAHSEYVCSELEILSREGIFLCDEPWLHSLVRIVKTILLYSSAPLFLVVLAFLLAGWRRRVLAAALAQDRRETAEALHDAVAQQLAGARLMVFSVKAREDIPPSVRANLDSVIGALESARRDVRDAILRLKSDESLQKPLETLIRDMASAINARGEVHLKTRLSAFPDSVTGENKANVLAIIQEAVTNAVRHGQAKKVVVIAERSERSFVLSILNDGLPFEAAKALGPEVGHFGLSNMRGRAERSGFTLSFGMRKGWVEVRLEAKR